MDYVTNNLYPGDVFKYFEEISMIPRGSGNEKAVSDYLVNFAVSHNLEVAQDNALNVIIKKPGTAGYENSSAVIIQGHMDMVCDKNNDKIHDFERDPIELRVLGDMLYASDTTLGADNGVAVAYSLALLASDDIAHPPLEVVATTGEEVGLCGAGALDMSIFKGKYLINLDHGEEHKFVAGCAGGVRVKISVPIAWEDVPDGFVSYLIRINGLKGGHSGGEIDQGRGNSNKLMGRVLNGLNSSLDIYINKISGGLKTNAIPREAEAVVFVNASVTDKFMDEIKAWEDLFKREFRASDSGVCVTAESRESCANKVFSCETAGKAIASLVLIPNGIQSMSMEIKGLVESSISLGIVKTEDEFVTFESAIRSPLKILKQSILEQCRKLADILGGDFGLYSDYPGWEYNADSKLISMAKDIYKKMYDEEPEIVATHGGVECGIFKDKMPGLDMVCFGPDMYDIHTPNEHLNIPSTGRMWDFFIEVLKEMK